jgi:hypothetical protein
MTPSPGSDVLVCVYYRVAAVDAARANAVVREFQRGLAGCVPALRAESLLRFELTMPDATAAPEPPAAGADATLMETYRFQVPGAPCSAAAEDALRRFLHTLETASQGLAGLLRGSRHVELFAPCVS